MIDPYLDPESGVLRNHLGLTDRGLLSEFEDDISTAAMSVLRSGPLPGRYDLVHLQAFHRRIFGRVYPWAGEIRTVAIAKTDMFCLPQHIEPYATEVFGRLAAEGHLRRLDRKPFVERLTHYFAEVNAIHPFREGNGRTQRRSSANCPPRRVGPSAGSAWTLRRTSRPRSPRCGATTLHCGHCWTASSHPKKAKPGAAPT
jgi:cell filamentation protein, protein adenylyltransferase